MEQIWKKFGRAQVDMFASRETSQCPFCFFRTHPAPLALDAIVQTWPRILRPMPYFLHSYEQLASTFQKLTLLVLNALLSSLVSTSPARDVLPFRWTKYTHVSERGNTGAFPKRISTQRLVLRGTSRLRT